MPLVQQARSRQRPSTPTAISPSQRAGDPNKRKAQPHPERGQSRDRQDADRGSENENLDSAGAAGATGRYRNRPKTRIAYPKKLRAAQPPAVKSTAAIQGRNTSAITVVNRRSDPKPRFIWVTTYCQSASTSLSPRAPRAFCRSEEFCASSRLTRIHKDESEAIASGDSFSTAIVILAAV